MSHRSLSCASACLSCAFLTFKYGRLRTSYNMPTRNNSSQSRIGIIEIIFLILPLAFVALGVVLISAGTIAYCKAKLTESWPSTAGMVRNAHIRPYNDEDGIIYAPEIMYQYSVEGKPYESSTIQPEVFVHFSDENEAKRFLSKYP